MLRPALCALAAAAIGCGSSAGPCIATIHPSEVTAAPGDQIVFTSSLDGRPLGETVWTASKGFIDGVGDYTAPAEAGEYTVTVADRANPTCAATAKVHVVAPDAGAPDGGH